MLRHAYNDLLINNFFLSRKVCKIRPKVYNNVYQKPFHFVEKKTYKQAKKV